MPTTLLIIDPDVWRAATDDPRCALVILEAWKKVADTNSYVIGLDNGDVELEYVEMLESKNYDSNFKKILNDVFRHREQPEFVHTIKPVYTYRLQTEISRHRCDKPVEPTLIGMVAGTSLPVILWLAGNNSIRPRGLHDHNIRTRFRDFFRRYFHKGFQAHLASEISAFRRDEELDAYQRREFENQTRQIFMSRIHVGFGVMPSSESVTPHEVENYRDASGREAGDVDGYIFLDQENVRYVWVAECELREEGNEGQPTTCDKVEKLVRKIEAVQNYEMQRTLSDVQEVRVKGYLVTNAESCHESAEKLIEDNGFQFVPLKMPNGWTKNLHWHLRNEDVTPFAL